MPSYKRSAQPEPIKIDKFFGVNESIGETEIKLGEAVKQVNFRLTTDYKPDKRQGYKTFINFNNAKAIQGLWRGIISTKDVMIVCNDGYVYKCIIEDADGWDDVSGWTAPHTWKDSSIVTLGTITDAPTTIFYFGSKLYFLNGTDYKEYNGTTYQDVVPYIPTIFIEAPPTGGGTAYEQVNVLTGYKYHEFRSTGGATFQLSETSLDSASITATVNGVAKVETTDFTVNRTSGLVTFNSTTANESLVIVKYSKTISGNADLVKKNKYVMAYGLGNDTSIFMWGNPTYKNKRMWSGTLDPSYFPEFNFTLVGSDEFAITDIVSQYSKQIIFKEDRTYYSYPEYITTLEAYDYPVYDLNESVGNICPNGVQIINNSPVSLYKHGLRIWTNTSVEDERNEKEISQRIKPSLLDKDLSTAITYDNQKEAELWINIGSIVYVYNYGIDAFYMYDNIRATTFIEDYFGSYGTIEHFEGLNDNGTAIYGIIELGFTDFDASNLNKTTRLMWISIKPYDRTSLDIGFSTNKLNTDEAIYISPIEYKILSFDDIDFGDFSFETNLNPQPFRRKIRARKYAFIKFIFINDKDDEQCTILNCMILAETQGMIK